MFVATRRYPPKSFSVYHHAADEEIKQLSQINKHTILLNILNIHVKKS